MLPSPKSGALCSPGRLADLSWSKISTRSCTLMVTTIMPVYCFELNFAVSKDIDLNPSPEEQHLTTVGQPISLMRQRGLVARNRPRFIIRSCGFEDDQEASTARERLRDLILIGATTERVGVDFGPAGFMYGAVFPQGTLQHTWVDPPPPAPITPAAFAGMIDVAKDKASALTDRQRIAAELLNDSQFEMSDDARFLLRISAIEALCPQADLGLAFSHLVDRLLASMPAGESGLHVEVISGALKNARRQSVRRACLAKITQLLGGQSARDFDELYEQRSKFVHEGQLRGRLGEAASRAYDLALELLLADIETSRPRGGEPWTRLEPKTDEESNYEPALGAAKSKSEPTTEEEAKNLAEQLNARNRDQSVRYKATGTCSGWAVEIQERRCYWGHGGYTNR